MATFGNRNGQSMVEFLLGLVGVMVLMLALDLAAQMAFSDMDGILGLRSKVADELVAGNSASPGYAGANTYNLANVEQILSDGFVDGGYNEWVNPSSPYASGLPDGFAFLQSGEDPLANMVGESGVTRIDITSPFFREAIGRNAVQLDNSVWMPPWDDLLP